MSIFSFFSRRNRKASVAAPKRPLRTRPLLEALEDRFLPSCSVISGFVYHDANSNGLFDAGETPIANSTLELRNANNAVVGHATTDAAGYYEFTHDETTNQGEQTLTKTLNFPSTETDYTLSGQVDQFDETLGELLSIEIIHEGSITSEIKVENTSPISTSTITGTVSGKLKLTGANVDSELTLQQNAGNFSASIYDGTKDYGGTSGTSFGVETASGTQTITLTGQNMAAYKGTGKVSFSENAQASSHAAGGGNLDASIVSSGTSKVTVIYKYRPSNCLAPGDYTIVQTPQPSAYKDGQESSGGVVLNSPPGTDSIPVTLAQADIPNNNFGEHLGSLSGFVYADRNDNGQKEAGEEGIAGVTITLTGADDKGPVSKTFTTDANGLYEFTALRAGTYTITETTQPAGYLDGKDTIGTPGGNAAVNEVFSSVVLVAGFAGVDNNFGEIPEEVSDLGIVKSASQSNVLVGTPLTYTLTITNYGKDIAKNVKVEDALPPEVQFIDVTGAGWTFAKQAKSFVATMPSLAVGASAEIFVSIKAPGVPATLVNTGIVSSDTPDNNPTNNSSTVTVTVFDRPGEFLPKGLEPMAINIGGTPTPSKHQLFTWSKPAINGADVATIAFIDGAYQTFLGRTSTLDERAYWKAQFASGVAKDTLANALWNTDEHRNHQAAEFYDNYLDRAPTAVETAELNQKLRNDGEIEAALSLLTSVEYQASHPTANTLVTGLFTDILNRTPDALGQAATVQALNNQTTDAVARSMLLSDEGLSNIIDDAFREILRRPAGAGEILSWTASLKSNQHTVGQMMLALLVSPEFQQLAINSVK